MKKAEKTLKTKKGELTELVFILDKSGSMSGLESDTVGGFNSMIEKQKREEGDALVTTILFSTEFETLHDRVPLENVKKLTGKDYVPCGCTALIDAVGDTIEHIEKIHKYIREEDRPKNTVFVITTDGLENASHRYTAEDVKKMINAKEETGWTFIFLGANIDAAQTANSFGIKKENAVDYHCDKKGVSVMYNAVNCALGAVRKERKLSKDWRAEIDEDYKKRK